MKPLLAFALLISMTLSAAAANLRVGTTDGDAWAFETGPEGIVLVWPASGVVPANAIHRPDFTTINRATVTDPVGTAWTVATDDGGVSSLYQDGVLRAALVWPDWQFGRVVTGIELGVATVPEPGAWFFLSLFLIFFRNPSLRKKGQP